MNHFVSHRSWWGRCRDVLVGSLLIVAAVALAACSGGGQGSELAGNGSNSGSSAQACSTSCGAAMISLTDAAGDFDSYLVNIVSLQLTRDDGTVVQMAPVTTQVDFSQLVDLSEIVSAAQIPAGRYASASMTLDYAGASIVVDNGTTGVTIAQSNIIDGATGSPLAAPNLTQMTVTLSLPSSAPFVVTANEVANLALDLNLAASNAITPSNTTPTTVTVNPVLTARLAPDATKTLEVRGLLVSVDTAASSYVIGVRPFYNLTGVSGQLTVNTTASTTYTINGTAYTGGAGLTQLSTLAAGTLTRADGIWDTSTQSFTASTVLAGSSVIGVRQDSVQGTVIARSGDTLTLANGLLLPAASAMAEFQPTVTVTVGSGTTVIEVGETGTFDIQDLSVGQHALFFGAIAIMGGTVSFDATEGSALLVPTRVTGTVNAVASGTVTLTLLSLDGRPASVFNFAGTGTSSGTDASATAYVVSVPASLTTGSLATGAPASFIGFVNPFGSAPPDFNAVTFINYAQTNALLRVWWSPPGIMTPFATLTDSELLMNQATLMAAAGAVLSTGPLRSNAAAFATGIQIVPSSSDTNPQLAIVHLKSHDIDSYATFNDFATALTSELNGVNAALQVVADGPFDATTAALSANAVAVLMND